MPSTIGSSKRCLSASALNPLVRKQFDKINDTRRQASTDYSLSDTLMSAFAMFQFKMPSLLQFENNLRDHEPLIGNLKRLYWLDNVPSDTQMRSILDTVSPASLRGAFRAVHSVLQRTRVLEQFKVLDGRFVVSIDGTGLFSSSKVQCEHCGVKKRKNGTTEYYHQLLAAAIVSPDQKIALPIDFEPIIKSDGQKKDCCERNAAKRLIPSIAAQYPKRRFIVVEDALACNGPHVKLLKMHGMDFVIGARPTDATALFAAFDSLREHGDVVEFEQVEDNGVVRGCRFANDLPINDSHADERVNLIEFWEEDKKGKVREWSWITSLEITVENALEIARIARSRWAVENQVFNTLKNQGYHLEHNFGHGSTYLSSTLAGLMLLAFLCDQVQEYGCELFKAARQRASTKRNLWAKIQSYLQDIELPDWDTLWLLIGGGLKLQIAQTDDTG